MMLSGPLDHWAYQIDAADGVAHVPVRGSIGVEPPLECMLPPYRAWCGADHLAAVLAACEQDERCGAVVLWIDSPGGLAEALPRVLERLASLRAAKPVFAYAAEMAASAAYWIAASCDRLWCASAFAQVGSIGTIFGVLDTSRNLEMHGLAMHYVTDAEHKTLGAPGAPFTDAHRADLERKLGVLTGAFAAALSESRGISAELIAELAGRTVFAEEAVAMGLADAIVPRAEVHARALAEAAAMVGAEADAEAEAQEKQRTAPSV